MSATSWGALEMKDLTRECLSDAHDQARKLKAPPLKEHEFRVAFCSRCKNSQCLQSGWDADLFTTRVSSQEERLLNPRQADPDDPVYREVRSKDFQDLFQKAMALTVSSVRGDWEIPNFQVSKPEPAPKIDTTTHVLPKPLAPVQAPVKRGNTPNPGPVMVASEGNENANVKTPSKKDTSWEPSNRSGLKTRFASDTKKPGPRLKPRKR